MYNDFILLQADRASFEALVDLLKQNLSNDSLIRILEPGYLENYEFAYAKLFENSKRGDRVMIQSVERMDAREWFQVAGIPYNDQMRQLWRIVLGNIVNMYANLADEAYSRDREIIPLDSRRSKEWWKRSQLGKNARERVWFEYRYRFGRSSTMVRDINKRKPHMVIASSPHAAIIELEMQPKKSIWAMRVAHGNMRSILNERRNRERVLIERLTKVHKARKRLRELRQKRRITK